jgi:fatty acid desaturase
MDAQFADCMRTARSLVDPAFIRSLKAPRPTAVFVATALMWGQLLLSWGLALFGPLWLAWIPFIVHGAITQAMLLWVHEASHFNLRPERRDNDIWSDIFFAGPIGMSTAAYRSRHMSHHAHLGTPDDADRYPYLQSIKGARALAWVLIKALSGALGIWLILNKYGPGAQKNELGVAVSPRWIAPLVTVVFNLGLLSLCVATGRWYLYFALWVYPILAVAIALNIVRTIAEHQPEDYPRFENGESIVVPLARTTVPNPFEKWVMYQANFNYHIEHHLFPAIPQHNLAKLHRHFVEVGFYQRYPGNLQRSGFAKFIELSRNRKHDDFTDSVEDALAT